MTFFIKQGINNQYSVDSTIVSLHVTQLGKFWKLVMCLLRAAPCIATRLRCRDCWERIEWAIRTQRLLQVADTPHVKARRSEGPPLMWLISLGLQILVGARAPAMGLHSHMECLPPVLSVWLQQANLVNCSMMTCAMLFWRTTESSSPADITEIWCSIPRCFGTLEQSSAALIFTFFWWGYFSDRYHRFLSGNHKTFTVAEGYIEISQ
jgi:hypothetical protein